ncbi:MAG: diaminopimelate epimerase [Candidatus Brocadiaceae bacterium]
MGIEFVKMAGTGNDFIVLDNRDGVVGEDRAGFAQRHCPRRTAVGADGVLLIEPGGDADFRMRIFNADGSEAEMCGNGARCAARFAFVRGIAGSVMTMETIAGAVTAEVADDTVTVGMGDVSPVGEETLVEAEGRTWVVHPVEAGVPHGIVFVEDLENAPVHVVGRAIRLHPAFQPRGTNVDFVQPVGERAIDIRTYERGVEAETLACGTGAIAAAVVSSALGHVEGPPVNVGVRGGQLVIDFRRDGAGIRDVRLSGDARFIYQGQLLE